MKKSMFSFLLFIAVICSSSVQYTPHNWTLVIQSTGEDVSGGYYTASACAGLAEYGGLIANPSNPFSYYFCDNKKFITNVMGCPATLVFDPIQLVCNFKWKVDLSYWPNFPWDDYPA